MTIADNGVGFDPADVVKIGHQGLANTRERATKVSGTVTIDSRPGAGTRVIVRVPNVTPGEVPQCLIRPTAGQPLTLVLVDDHEVVRQGLAALLGRRDEFQVVGEAGTVADAVAAARRLQPDLVIMDVRLPDGSGIEACREIRAERPDTRVVMLTSYPDEDAVLSAIIAGASGYLLKQVRARDLVAALDGGRTRRIPARPGRDGSSPRTDPAYRDRRPAG